MKILLKIISLSFLLLLVNISLLRAQNTKGHLFVANWNLENLYDTMDDPKIDDNEFLPDSAKHWTYERYQTKLKHLARVIEDMNNGKGPDILGVEEVENILVIKELIYKIKTKNRDYITAHIDSPDNRGIDASLIFDRTKLEIDTIIALHVTLPDKWPTRDVLWVRLILKSNMKDTLNVFVNHWPSRIGGEEKSEPNRIAAANVLKAKTDSLLKANENTQVIIVGDFNDEPANKSIRTILGANPFNCGLKKIVPKNELFDLASMLSSKGEGTYLYKTNWNMLDQIIVSGNMINLGNIYYNCDSFSIFKPVYMITKEGDKKGAALSTFEWNTYIGGYSDHYPVTADFIIKGKDKK